MIESYKKGKDINVMIWDVIYENGRFNIVFMKRDLDLNKSRYLVNSYLNVLYNQISQVYKSGRIFIQDNVSIYTVKKVKKWFKDKEIKLFEWLLYNPDLNPIKHLWM